MGVRSPRRPLAAPSRHRSRPRPRPRRSPARPRPRRGGLCRLRSPRPLPGERRLPVLPGTVLPAELLDAALVAQLLLQEWENARKHPQLHLPALDRARKMRLVFSAQLRWWEGDTAACTYGVFAICVCSSPGVLQPQGPSAARNKAGAEPTARLHTWLSPGWGQGERQSDPHIPPRPPARGRGFDRSARCVLQGASGRGAASWQRDRPPSAGRGAAHTRPL